MTNGQFKQDTKWRQATAKKENKQTNKQTKHNIENLNDAKHGPHETPGKFRSSGRVSSSCFFLNTGALRFSELPLIGYALCHNKDVEV